MVFHIGQQFHRKNIVAIDNIDAKTQFRKRFHYFEYFENNCSFNIDFNVGKKTAFQVTDKDFGLNQRKIVIDVPDNDWIICPLEIKVLLDMIPDSVF